MPWRYVTNYKMRVGAAAAILAVSVLIVINANHHSGSAAGNEPPAPGTPSAAVGVTPTRPPENPIFVDGTTHPMKYYVSLPDGWSNDKEWPVIISAEPAGGYADVNQSWAKARKNLPFIIVTPVILTNTGDPLKFGYSKQVADDIVKNGAAQFDQNGLLTIIDDVAAKYHGQKKVFITGFSAGGHLTWLMIFHHPEKLRGAALSAGNYIGRGMEKEDFSSAEERRSLPIKEFLGEKDRIRESLLLQWQNASTLAKSYGYGNLSIEDVPGADHTRFTLQVLSFFQGLLSGP